MCCAPRPPRSSQKSQGAHLLTLQGGLGLNPHLEGRDLGTPWGSSNLLKWIIVSKSMYLENYGQGFPLRLSSLNVLWFWVFNTTDEEETSLAGLQDFQVQG